MSTSIPEPHFELLPDKTTNSGKTLYRCTGCGYETPAPDKHHKCEDHLQPDQIREE